MKSMLVWRARCTVLNVLLLGGGVGRIGMAVHPSAQTGEAASSSTRLLRSEDATLDVDGFIIDPPLASGEKHHRLHVELDSTGKGRMGSAIRPGHASEVALVARDERLATDPDVKCESFECITVAVGEEKWIAEVDKTPIPFPDDEWVGISGDGGVRMISSDDPAFGNVHATDGNNLLGLWKKGSAIFQNVPDHVENEWYTLWWYATCYSTDSLVTNASLKVSVDGANKFNEGVNCGSPFQWYKVSYQALGLKESDQRSKRIRFEIPANEPQGDIWVLLDKIVIHKETPWDFESRAQIAIANPNTGGGTVLIEKVECGDIASVATCTRGKFLTCGDFSSDAETPIGFETAARPCSLFSAHYLQAAHKWKFKCNCLTNGAAGQADDDWWLHSGYGAGTCEAKNSQGNVGASHVFDIREGFLNPQGSQRSHCPGCPMLQLTTHGASCGSLFVITEHQR